MPNFLPPPPVSLQDTNLYQWTDWFRKLRDFVSDIAGLAWQAINFSGSNITDIETREHNDLQTIQGGTTNQYYHLTATDYIGNGTGTLVRTTSPTLVTPALGTPTALVGTNITGTAAGLTAGNVTTNANLTGVITSIGNATSLGSFSSANLRTALTDETGTGSAVFATSPTISSPTFTGSASLGTPAGGNLVNCTGYVGTSALVTVGALNSGSITSGFGSIDIGTDTLQAGDTQLANLEVNGEFNGRSISSELVINAATTYGVQTTDHTIVQTTAASVYTLLNAATYPGRTLVILNQYAGTITSASSNVVPLVGGSAAADIIPATAGSYAVLQSNGTYWQIIMATPTVGAAGYSGSIQTAVPNGNTLTVVNGLITGVV